MVDLHTRGGMMNKWHNESVVSACISFLLRDARRVSSVNAVIKFPRILSRILFLFMGFPVLNPGDNICLLLLPTQASCQEVAHLGQLIRKGICPAAGG